MGGQQYRKTPRAPFFEYEEGVYFVTICTKNKLHYFGKIANGSMGLSAIGQFLDNQINNASQYFPEVEVPLYVIMPNHLHMIVCINARRDMPLACGLMDMPLACGLMDMPSTCGLMDVPSACGLNVMAADTRNPNPYERPIETCQRHVPTLSRYINSLKGAVTKYSKRINMEFGWQSRYHDHVIRGSYDGDRIAEYIENNVARWGNDCFNQ